jgi:hypothetical protein
MLEGFDTGDVTLMTKQKKVLNFNIPAIILMVWATVIIFTDWLDSGFPDVYTSAGYLETKIFVKLFAVPVLLILSFKDNQPIYHKLVPDDEL